MTDVIHIETNLSPGRFRKQKARIKHGVQTRLKRQAEQAAQEAKHKDRFYHTYAERVRLIRQMKSVLGYPLIQHEGFEYKSNYYTSKTLDDELVKNALRYWDSMVPASQFDGLMSTFEAFWEVEQWLLERETLVNYVEWKGEWWKRPSRSNDRIPQFKNPYWIEAKLVDMSNSDWHMWKVHPPKEAQTDTVDECSNALHTVDPEFQKQIDKELRFQTKIVDQVIEGANNIDAPKPSLAARIAAFFQTLFTSEKP